MILQINKKYKTSFGAVVKIIDEYRDKQVVMFDGDDGRSYYIDGTYEKNEAFRNLTEEYTL